MPEQLPGNADPSYDAERRAIQRGLEDLLKDTKSERKQGKQDYQTTREDIKIDRKRGLKDIGLGLERGLLDIRNQRTDVRQDRDRGREDFTTRIAGLARSYTQQQFNQGQALNAAGAGATSGASTLAAQRRAENMALDRAPLDTDLSRMEQDVDTSLERLGTGESQLRQDTGLGRRRLKQDVRHDKTLAKRDYRRDRKDIHTERQRAIREAEITRADLLKSAVWSARRS